MRPRNGPARPLRGLRLLVISGALVLTGVLGSWLLHVGVSETTGSWAGSSPVADSHREQLLPQRLSAGERIRMIALRSHAIVSLRAG